MQVVTRFAVPALLLCSGFLYATTSPVPTATLAQRLRRVLVPYLVASAAAQIWWAAHGSAQDAPTVARELLLGSSFGPYYYVFVHFFLVLCVPLFAILPRALFALLTAVLLLSQGYLESGMAPVVPFFWHLRNPLLW